MCTARSNMHPMHACTCASSCAWHVYTGELRALYPWDTPEEEGAAVATLGVRRAVCRHLSSALKVFVADCDHTLWEGVASEQPEGASTTAVREWKTLLEKRATWAAVYEKKKELITKAGGCSKQAVQHCLLLPLR